MPRKAPDNVTEHRVTLGNYERDLLTQTIDDFETQMLIRSITNTSEAVAYAVAGVAVGVGLYYGLPKISGNLTDSNFGLDFWGENYEGYRAEGRSAVDSASRTLRDFFQKSLWWVPNEEGEFGFKD